MIIHIMNYPDIDLNDLAAFDAIRRTGSITRAAIELGMAQSTLSNRLRRMRALMSDPLFIKTADGMLPTPYSETICGRITEALAVLDKGIRNKGAFDAAKETRSFTILMINIAEVLLVPLLLQRCKREAPGISFTTRSLPDREIEKVLRSGDADVAIGFFPGISARLMQRPGMEASYACIAAANHPTIGKSISRKEFLSARYAIAEAKGTGHHVIEMALQREGVAHRIGARLSDFLPLAMVVAATDMVAIVPKPMAEFMRDVARIKVLPHPLNLPRTHQIRLFWHERFHHDPANSWLRGILVQVCKSVDAATRRLSHRRPPSRSSSSRAWPWPARSGPCAS